MGARAVPLAARLRALRVVPPSPCTCSTTTRAERVRFYAPRLCRSQTDSPSSTDVLRAFTAESDRALLSRKRSWSSWSSRKSLAQPDLSGNSFGNKGWFVTLGFRKYLRKFAYASQKAAIALDRNKLSVGLDHNFQKPQLEIWPLCPKTRV